MSSADELAYIKDLKSMILADARALYSAHGLTSRTVTFEVMTSKKDGAYQATLIAYPDLSANNCWSTLYEGLRCTNICAAMKMLWDGVQELIGALKAFQYRALMSPASTTTTKDTMWSTETSSMSPTTPTFGSDEITTNETNVSSEDPVGSPLIVNGSPKVDLSPIEEKDDSE